MSKESSDFKTQVSGDETNSSEQENVINCTTNKLRVNIITIIVLP